MPSTTFVARRPGPLSALDQSAEIGGLRLEPAPPVRVLDRFYDTDDAELLRRGLALRVREQGGERVASLRPIEGDAGPAGEVSLYADLGAGDAALRLPPSVLADAVHRAIGDDALRPLLTLRQYRTPRLAYDGDTPVGVVSFDVVVYEVPGGRVVSYEVEVEPAGGADPAEVLGPALEAQELEPAPQPKFARAILHQRRPLSEPVLLLPYERRRLESVVASTADSSVRRRAHVVLLDARGFRPDTIASQTGLSMTRVQFWRERFREVRLGLLDPSPPPAPAVRAPAPPTVGPAAWPPTPEAGAPEAAMPEPAAPAPSESTPVESVAPEPTTPEPTTPPVGSEGDGVALESLSGAASALDMAELLELFSPTAPDTPFFDGGVEADPAPRAPEPGPVSPAQRGGGVAEGADLSAQAVRQNPYPVVLGPVEAAPAGRPSARTERRDVEERFDPFAEVDVGQLRRARRAARAAEAPARRPAPVERAPEALASPPSRPLLDGATPLLEAAQAMLAYAAAAFDAHAASFLATGTPSDARRLLVAAHELRLTAETFGLVLPAHAADRLVAALRPLAADLDDALETARTALAAGGRPDLVRRAGDALVAAADRLRGGREPWGARAHRLAARLAAQSEAGVLISDDAPLRDDFVGEPGDAPTPTRLGHLLGSTIWARFEAVRALEDAFDVPTAALASHLAVALSGLRFVLQLAEPSADPAGHDVSRALEAAEHAVVDIRRRRDPDGAASALREVWDEVTSAAFKKRIAAVVASV